MFFKLAFRNGRKSRKENGLFFSTLLITVIAFYIILSLPNQDVMIFLQQMESDAVKRLISMLPLFFGAALVILFFLVYYAGKYQMQRRRHEFGLYLMMGMRRRTLFLLLLAEDLYSSIFPLIIGLPVAVLLSELISLVTARIAGMGVIGHRFSFSPEAALLTAAGFLLIKLAAFLILSGRVARQEIGSLLVEMPEGVKRQLPGPVYGAAAAAGLICLGVVWWMASTGISWLNLGRMGVTLLLGLCGTWLLFFGLRFVMNIFAKRGDKGGRLQVFHFRQLEETHSMENVIYNELLMLGFSVDVGVVQVAERDQNDNIIRKQLEVDFVCNLGSLRYYIQSAYSLPDEEKRTQEIRPFRKIDDSFRKIIITKDIIQPYYDDYGILTVNIYDFLLDPQVIEK